MSFVSLSFLTFYSLTLLLYYTLCRTWQSLLLLGASILFYCFGGPKYIIYILIVMLSTYFSACFISNIYSSQDNFKNLATPQLTWPKESCPKRAHIILKINFLIILGLFIFLKYFNFLAQTAFTIGGLFHLGKDPLFLNLILPLGLSYYTFTNIGYILDVYWKRIPAEKSILNFFLFTIYFPHIVQGPISRYSQLAPQFASPKKFNYDQVTSGLQLILWGYFKKMVIADRINILVSEVIGNYNDYYGVVFIVAIALYSIQIYADFSGCMDIVGGISETFGISLAKNFDHPYFSRTIPEFWRRWHITLGAWFKDYVYYPISISSFVKKTSKKVRKKWGAKVGRKFTACVPTLSIWILTGIWHGAAWNFVLWGLFHALLMTTGIICEEFNHKLTKTLKIQTDTFSWRLFQITRTFILCCIGRIFFIAPNGVQSAFDIIGRIFSRPSLWQLFDGTLLSLGLDGPNFVLMLITIGILWSVSELQEKMELRKEFAKQNIIFRWTILYMAIFSILIFGIYGAGYDASAFIYNQF